MKTHNFILTWKCKSLHLLKMQTCTLIWKRKSLTLTWKRRSLLVVSGSVTFKTSDEMTMDPSSSTVVRPWVMTGGLLSTGLSRMVKRWSDRTFLDASSTSKKNWMMRWTMPSSADGGLKQIFRWLIWRKRNKFYFKVTERAISWLIYEKKVY